VKFVNGDPLMWEISQEEYDNLRANIEARTADHPDNCLCFSCFCREELVEGKGNGMVTRVNDDDITT
jgi:hypothetical protein